MHPTDLVAGPEGGPDISLLADPTSIPAERPDLRAVLTRVVMSVVTAVVLPGIVLWTMLRFASFPAAVLVALGWMVATMSWRWATGRPVSGLLMLTLGILTVRTSIALATGSTAVYFVQPVFTDLVVATLFLGSLWSARPLVARLAPDFYPMDAAVTACPQMRCLFRRLTLMWGMVIVVKAALTVWLLASLSTVDFVAIKGGAIALLTITAAVVTVVWSVFVGREAGLLAPR